MAHAADTPDAEPRGGIAPAPGVIVGHEAFADGRAVAAPGLSSFESNRRVLPAMVGTYCVHFDLLEVATFDADAKRHPPYLSRATERVFG